MVWMMTPQLTAQYGQVLRVSVVREIFSACGLRVQRLQIETEHRNSNRAGDAGLEKCSSR